MDCSKYRRQSCVALAAIVVVCAGLSPISDDAFWWDQARGRAVLAGSITPALDLLANEAKSEADWLGGVPGYLVFRLLGLGGLTLLKIVLTCGLLALLLRSTPRQLVSRSAQPKIVSLCVAGIGMFAATDAFDSVGHSLDLICLVLVGRLLEHAGERAASRTMIALCLVMMVWANMARLPIFGVLLAVQHLVDSPLSRRSRLTFAACVLSACLTPRGMWTLWDSARLLVPRLTHSAATLRLTEFRPTVSGPWDEQVVAYVLACLMTVVCLIRFEKNWSRIAAGFAIIGIGWSARSHVAPAAVWITMQSLGCLRHAAITAPAAESRVRFVTGCSVFALIVVAAGAAGSFWPDSRARLGIGLSPRLDIRLFEASLQNCPLKGTAHGVGLRSAGMLAWIAGGNGSADSGQLRLDDVPVRALLGNRLSDRVLLQHDLESGVRNPQRREDGSWAGWWVPLQRQGVSVLVVPAEQTQLIRALEPTWWKPLSLDAPVIPFGRAGDPDCATRLIHVLQERQFVDQGEWSYAPATGLGLQQHVDVWGLLAGDARWQTAMRQARVFQAMNLHTAAMRVLQTVIDGGDRAADHELTRCRQELEWTARLTGTTTPEPSGGGGP
jgi:hypothetical protein